MRKEDHYTQAYGWTTAWRPTDYLLVVRADKPKGRWVVLHEPSGQRAVSPTFRTRNQAGDFAYDISWLVDWSKLEPSFDEATVNKIEELYGKYRRIERGHARSGALANH